MAEDVKRSPVPAVDRAVAVLDYLAQSRGVPRTLSDLSRETGVAKSSMSNLCGVLEDARLIRRSDAGYLLGRKTVELGGAYLASIDQVREFYQVCTASKVLGRELVQIAMLDGTQVIYLARHEGRTPLRLSANIGDRFPASCTATGACLLAQLDPAQVSDRYRDPLAFAPMTADSPSSVEELQAKLAATRERGYGLDDEEVQPGVMCLAVLIPSRSPGAAELAVGVTMLKASVTPQRREEVLDALHSLAEELANPMAPLS